MTHEHALRRHGPDGGRDGTSPSGCEIALDVLAGLRGRRTTSSRRSSSARRPTRTARSARSRTSRTRRATTAVDIFREVLTGSDLAPKLDAELAELLPDLLWLHLMVVVLYWVFDRTEDTERTRDFVRRSTPLVAKLIALSRYRVFRPMVRDAKGLIQDFILPTIGRTAVTRSPAPPRRN